MKQTGRYELKYVIEEDRAVAVADYVRAFLRPSEHNGTGPSAAIPSSASTWIRPIIFSTGRLSSDIETA